MKFIHLSDLHLGKHLCEYSLIDDQRDILDRILETVRSEKPDAVLIAGDIYDRPVPPTEAVKLFDWFLVELSNCGLHVFVISGNHDSAERISFGGKLMEQSRVHISPVYTGEISPVTLSDSYGNVNIYMLPFVKPVDVRSCFPNAEIGSYTDAVKTAIENMDIDTSERNILIAHQFVTGAEPTERSGSEETTSVGGLDNVDASVFDCFDYVALGHIHRTQNIGSERIRYCGAPLKYAILEVGQQKSLTVAELKEKNNLTVHEVPLIPTRDVTCIRAEFNSLISPDMYGDEYYQNSYVHFIIIDNDEKAGAAAILRDLYPWFLSMVYDNKHKRYIANYDMDVIPKIRTNLELFAEFFKSRTGERMSLEQEEYMRKLIESAEESIR